MRKFAQHTEETGRRSNCSAHTGGYTSGSPRIFACLEVRGRAGPCFQAHTAKGQQSKVSPPVAHKATSNEIYTSSSTDLSPKSQKEHRSMRSREQAKQSMLPRIRAGESNDTGRPCNRLWHGCHAAVHVGSVVVVLIQTTKVGKPGWETFASAWRITRIVHIVGK